MGRMSRLCFVIMPFGTKTSVGGRRINFDSVYETFIAPTVVAAGLEPLRADEELIGGIIHLPMFERILLCEFAIADLTTGNPNVAYELGIRHAVRPASTVLLTADVDRLPFDLAFGRVLSYRLTSDGNVDASAVTEEKAALTQWLDAAKRDGITDSPLFQLIDGFDPPKVDHLKAESFTEAVSAEREANRRISAAASSDELDVVAADLGPLAELPVGVSLHLFLARRDLSDFASMAAMFDHLPRVVQRTVLVREQYALALNRLGRRDEAEEVIKAVLTEAGPSSETYGILGRIHKDRWRDALKRGAPIEATGHLKQAAIAYRTGFETDWRDAYPGINALEMLFFLGDRQDELEELQPVVTYAVRRKVASGEPDYWDHATLLELAVLGGDTRKAFDHLADVLGSMNTTFEGETTSKTLEELRSTREARNESSEMETTLLAAIAETMSTLKR
jgi:hypothetical protein